MRILVIGGIAASLLNFRGKMLQAMLDAGHEVHSCAGEVTPELEAKIRAMGVHFHSIELQRRGINVQGDLIYCRDLLAIVGKVAPDVVLAYTIKPVIYGALAASKSRVPVIAAMITGAGAAQPGETVKERAVSFVARRLYRYSLRRVTHLFFQNRDDEILFRKIGIRPKVAVFQIAGSGVDLHHYKNSSPPRGPVSFLMIARLLAKKGVIEYANAAAELRAKFGDQIRCCLVGPIENGGGITSEMLSGWQSDGRLEYLGSLDDVRPAIQDCSVYVLPSYYGEGVPRTVLEAMATGRAIITADSPGCRETVISGRNGFLVEPRNSHALASAMQEFVTQTHLIETMGAASREIAEERFDVNAVNRQILTALGLLPNAVETSHN